MLLPHFNSTPLTQGLILYLFNYVALIPQSRFTFFEITFIFPDN